MANQTLFFNLGKFKVPVTLIEENNRYFIKAPFNRKLIEEIKCMEGAKWHGSDEVNPRKLWSISITNHNLFQIRYLIGQNPYALYDKPLDYTAIKTDRPLFEHQKEMLAHALTRKQCIIAAEMGCGKSLSMIELLEHVQNSDTRHSNGAIWVAPRSALYSVQLELKKWKSKVTPRLFTYEGLKKELADWPSDKKPPFVLIYDESSRLKNPTAQRTQAAQYLADQMRLEYGEDCYIIEMSGSPSPNSPLDWFSQCKIARPGYLKEGNIHKFRDRVGIVERKESYPGGGVYPSVVTWKDDESKCNHCGQAKDHFNHGIKLLTGEGHAFEPSVNEVSYLYERMKGLVLVKRKKDCLDLPEKFYKIIKLEPTLAIKNAAKIIAAKAQTTIEKLTLLRELSDGFQYQEDAEGKRLIKQINTPKEQALADILDEHEEVGRLVIYAGFTGSIDRCIQTVQKSGWQYIRADGRGWTSSLNDKIDPTLLLESFQSGDKVVKIAFIGQPGAAGLGLTLTASPTIVYYSNDFNYESRVQSEDRIHRIGMRAQGCTIIDLIHLETDQFVLDNLKRKKRLQDLTLGEIPV